MTRFAVFPGQGAQAVGMGRSLCDTADAARRVFGEVDAALGLPLTRLTFEGPLEELTLTQNAQPALMACSLAAVRALEQRAGSSFARLFDFAAGHSLGEYSALAAAGSMPVGQAAALLRLRGIAMQEAVPPGAGAMAAIIGLPSEEVEAIAETASVGDDVCELANDNGYGQSVLSGRKSAVERAVGLARERGAKRAQLLQVSAPFHCRLMRPAALRLGEALRATQFVDPRPAVLSNVTARPVTEASRLPDLLTRQVTSRVRWREIMATMRELGASVVVEFGPGRVLSGLVRRSLPDVRTLAIQNGEDIEPALQALAA